MNADERRYLNDLSERVIGCAFEVSNILGAGFLEKVYRRALMHELKLQDISAAAEYRLQVDYKGELVGDYVVDILVENKLVLELKCVTEFAPEHLAQALNYLRATKLPLALLLNFQKPRVEIKRVVHNF